MSTIYRGTVVVTEEADRRFWPNQAPSGFIREARVEDGQIHLTWGSLGLINEETQIPWSELRSHIGEGLPDPSEAVNLPGRDAFCLVFRAAHGSDLLRERLSNGNLHEIGVLMSDGFHVTKS